jgi:ubiquinone/menaquinone biosynthesis C-methylase UbiE
MAVKWDVATMSTGDLKETSSEPALTRGFSREEVQKEFSRVASFYDLWAGLTESKAVMRALELADIRDGERVLEVAVGTGIDFREIVERNKHGTNEGVDISPDMLSSAIERMKDYDPSCFHLQEGSAYSLPFNDNKFDLVVNNYMLDLLPESDFVNILREFFRVLRPNGRLVTVTMASGEKWYNQIWPWLARHFPSLLTNCRPVSIETHVMAAGFENVEAECQSQNTFPSRIVTGTKP